MIVNEPIAFTKSKLPYGWMGNMSPYPVIFEDVSYLTSEALFQSMRFEDAGVRALIRREKSPMMAKIVAKAHVDKMFIKPLSSEDVQNMHFCINLKLQQHPELQVELLKTGDCTIYEDVTARGAGGSNLFWGALKIVTGDWFGKNIVGEIWMHERLKLQVEEQQNKLKLL